jgi:CrcB protein
MRGVMPLVLVALGGAVGAVARVWLSGVVTHHLSGRFPWGTLVVNATGALAIGVLATILPAPAEAWREVWLILIIGILGSYTTVSSFSLQTLALARSGGVGQAVSNVLASLGLCLGAAFAGHLGGAWLFGG